MFELFLISAALLSVVVVEVAAVFPDPALLMLFATELREAPELDLLRFSFELVGRVDDPCFCARVELDGMVGLRSEEVELACLIITTAGLLVRRSRVEVDFRADEDGVVVKDLVEELMLG